MRADGQISRPAARQSSLCRLLHFRSRRLRDMTRSIASQLPAPSSASGTEQWAQDAKITNLLQLPNGIAQLARPSLTQDRGYQIVALLVDFGSRHRIFRGPADGTGMMSEIPPVAQADLDDALATRHRRG